MTELAKDHLSDPELEESLLSIMMGGQIKVRSLFPEHFTHGLRKRLYELLRDGTQYVDLAPALKLARNGDTTMKPEIESAFRSAIREGRKHGFSVRDVIGEMKAQGIIQSEKQAWRTLEKWIRRNQYEYGVSLDLGWLLPRDP